MTESPAGVWSDAAIVAASNAWLWDPPGTEVAETPRYRLALRPEGYRSAIVAWSRAADRAEADALVDELLARTATSDKERIAWWLRPGDEPADMDALLLERGFEQIEENDILAWELGSAARPRLPAIPVPDEVTVERVVDAATMERFYRINRDVFDFPLPPAAHMQREAEAQAAGDDPVASFVARIGDEEVATAGLTMADGPAGRVGRLWGAGTLEPWRGRGAYRALLRARLREAHARGASLALVRARVGTSGPILTRLGFRRVGTDRCFARAVAAPS